MLNLTQRLSGTLLTGILATGLVGATALNARPASAQAVIGGGGTCTPHPVSYEQYVPGHYNQNGVWIPSRYVTRSRMSTECNSYNPPTPPVNVNLAGMWYTDANHSGATTYINPNGPNQYRLINEQGRRSTAYVEGNRVFAPQWNVTGVIRNNGNQIAWSNGTHWFRYSSQTGFNPNINIPFGNSGAGINIRL